MSRAITVLVPLRGEAPFLQQALDSLRGQTLTDWQAVLCPLDETASRTAQAHASADARMQITDPGTHSQPLALAHAAATIDSELLCVLDGDDLLEPQALALMSAALSAAPEAGMAYSRHVLIDTAGRMLGPGPLCELPYSPDALLLDFMTGPLRLMRTQTYHHIGGYRATFPDASDYDLCLRLSETAAVIHLPHPLYRRRIHPQAPEVARWAEGIQARYEAFVAAVKRRGLDAQYDYALHIDSWHILQPLQPFGGIGLLR